MAGNDDDHDPVASSVTVKRDTLLTGDTSDLNMSSGVCEEVTGVDEAGMISDVQHDSKCNNNHDPRSSLVTKDQLIAESDGNNEAGNNNHVYQYLAREDGTSCEAYKIELHNIPRYANYSSLKHFFQSKLNLKPQKIKLIEKPVKFAFVAFKDETERNSALQSLPGLVWKGCKLEAQPAKPKADPLMLKRSNNVSDRNGSEKKVKRDILPEEDDNTNLSDRLNDQVAGLWRLPYDQQLEKKMNMVNEFLVDLHKDIGRMIDHSKSEAAIPGGEESKKQLFQWFLNSKRDFDRKPCFVHPIVPSPVISGYRNKCEFSIGTDKTVGFRLGCYKDGSVKVADVDNCPIVSPLMRRAVMLIEKYFKESSQFQPFDVVTHNGHWKQVAVRTCCNDSRCMITLTLISSGLTEEQIAKEKEMLKESLSDLVTGDDAVIKSLQLELLTHGKGSRKGNRYEVIAGEPTITEVMFLNRKELSFRISPDAFFQVNTLAAQSCFEKIAQLAYLNKETLLLDICCGTGTIGIALADRVTQVIGIELNEDAVRDAKLNATKNDVKNIHFIAGRAEDRIGKALVDHSSCNQIVAIVDPPRAGLNQSVMKTLRSTPKLDRVVYVSCDARFAKQNLVDLCRPVSKVYRGEPFVPVSVTPIDMFPHTDRCELIFVFERLQPNQCSTTEAPQTASSTTSVGNV